MRFAVLGNPIAHSLSPLIHQHFAQQCGIDLTYERLLVEGSLAETADKFFAAGGAGCNVTVPCKLEACAYASTLSDNAAAAGAVNTLKKEADGRISGFNTDGPGLMQDLKRLRFPLQGARVLLLGAGGAARGIVRPLLTEGISSLTIVNRTFDKAAVLATLCPEQIRACTYQELNAEIPSFHLVLNATAASLQGALPDVRDSVLQQAGAAYDLMYTPQGSTPFTLHCEELGVRQCADGIGMLIAQAALSFKIWLGLDADVAQTVSYLRTYLAGRKQA